MSYEIMPSSGTMVRKIKFLNNNKKIEKKILFFTISTSNNVSPKTYNWFLTKVLNNENEFKSYIQSFKSDITKGHIKINQSEYNE